jgi:hypothetical protein
LKFELIDGFADAKYWRSILGGLLCAALTVAFPIISMTKGALKNINLLSWDERILINLAIVFGAITAGASYKTIARFPQAVIEKKKRPSNLKEAVGWIIATLETHKAFLLLQATVLLNTAAAVLCKRISVMQIGKSGDVELLVSTFGLVTFACGGLLLGLSVIYRPLKATEKVVEATQGHSGGNSSGNGGSNGNGNGNGKDPGHLAVETKAAGTKPLPLVQYPELSAWLIIIASISLVENAWMPLLSLPGILVGMKWYLAGKAATAQFAGDGEELDVSKARWKIVPYVY